jgi:hypothetical protein
VRTARNLMVAAGMLLLPALVEGAGLSIASAWAPVPPKVDGTADTWAPFLRPLGDLPMVIGVQNDADFLYLCVKTSKPALKRQLLSTGLTAWANGKGKNSVTKGYGVRYPLIKAKKDKEHEGDMPEPTPAEEGSEAKTPSPLPQFELIGPSQDDRRLVDFADDQPVVAALGDDSGVMVLEMRIPMKPSDAMPLVMGVTPGTPVAVLLATLPPREKPSKVWADNVGGHSEVRPPDENAPEMPYPISLWIHVSLASPPPPAK